MDKSKDWILKNSKFPDTYKLIGFSAYDEIEYVEPKGLLKIMRKVPNSERYSIIHTYRIANNNGEVLLNYSKFVYDKDFKMKEFCYSLSDTTVPCQVYPEVLNDETWKNIYGK